MRKVKNWNISYKGYNIVQNGTEEYPYNIYENDGHGFGKHEGFERTIKEAKAFVDRLIKEKRF